MGMWGRRAQALAIAAVALCLAAPSVAAPALDLYYQRAVMVAADNACRLFAPDVARALGAAELQARNAALRSGAAAADLAAVESRATVAAQAAGCQAPSITGAASQLRAAFSGYAHLDHMDFPGEFAPWSAQRGADGDQNAWRVSQRDRFGWDEMLFGLAAHQAQRPLMAVVSFADGAQPYAARLVMRDVAVTGGPFLDWRQADLAGHLPIDARLPPRASTRTFQAEAMSPAGGDLAPRDMVNAWAVRFPAAAAAALAALDPRESVAVEFLFAGDDGETVRTAYVEVGDFAAAEAFEQVAQR